MPAEDVGWGAAGDTLPPVDVNASLEGISEVWKGAIESPTGSDVVVDDLTSFGHGEISRRDIDETRSRMTHWKFFPCIYGPWPLGHFIVCVRDWSWE